MSINTAKFEIALLKKLKASSNTSEVQAIITAKEQLPFSDIIVVQNFSNLPFSGSGQLYFVEADELLYIYAPNLLGENVWRPLHDMEYSKLYGVGNNPFGQLGNNTAGPSACCVFPVLGGFTDWCQVSAGTESTAAIRTNGTLWAWGCNGNGDGLLGDNTTVSKTSPVSVVGGFTNWCQVSVGELHTAAVRTNGTLWAWGRAEHGRLGDCTVVNKSSPISVIGGFVDWCQVSAGNQHTAAVRQNGTLYTWGRNNVGQLGDSSTTNRSSPVLVSGSISNWCQVSSGNLFTAAVRQNGSLWIWGNNCCGQLGDGTTVSKSSPVQVCGGFNDWCQVSAGCQHTAAVRQNGSLWAWGRGYCGALGTNANVDRCSPVSVVGGFVDWCQVSAGNQHTVAVRTSGSMWSWGNGACGRLGTGSITTRSSPVQLFGSYTDWCQVEVGACHTMGIRRKVF